MNKGSLEASQIEELRRLDSCSVANAIETFHVRLRNTGFSDATIHCLFPELPPMVGHAVTLRIRSSDPPMEGESYYYRLDWLDHVLSIPPPRVLVVEDMDRHPGLGAFIGDVHVNMLLPLGCVGVVTNGAVRNVDQIKPLRFQVFAAHLSISHAYAHVFDFGTPVEVGHLQIRPGDLLHGDRHGVQTIPLEIADEVSGVAREMIEQENKLMALCRSKEFSLERLRVEIAALGAKRKLLKR